MEGFKLIGEVTGNGTSAAKSFPGLADKQLCLYADYDNSDGTAGSAVVQMRGGGDGAWVTVLTFTFSGSSAGFIYPDTNNSFPLPLLPYIRFTVALAGAGDVTRVYVGTL